MSYLREDFEPSPTVDGSCPDPTLPSLTVDSRFRRFPELDGLRGSAVLLVIAGHTLVFRLNTGSNWGQLAALGVLIFFALSGFLITGLLCSEERHFGKISLRDFYLRRAFRILPAFSIFILTVSLLIATNLVTDTPWKTVAASMLYMKNIFGRGDTLGHLWSLSLEEQFYAIWPLVFAVAGRRRLLAPTIGFIVGIALWRFIGIELHLFDYQRGIFYLRPDFRMDSILVGCALALYLDKRSDRPSPMPPFLRWATHPSWTIPALVGWALYCEIPSLRAVYLSVETLLVISLLFHVIAFRGSAVGRVLRQRWICAVGLVSYSLYLWQQLFLVTSEPSWGFVRRLPYCLCFTASVAILSYFLVEQPFLRLKQKFARA